MYPPLPPAAPCPAPRPPRPPRPRPKRAGLRRLPHHVQTLVYRYDPTYRRVFNLTLLNLELLCQSLDTDVDTPGVRVGTMLAHEVRFEMDVASGVVWERARARK